MVHQRCLNVLFTRGCSIFFQLVLLLLPCLIIKSTQAALAASSERVDTELTPGFAKGGKYQLLELFNLSSSVVNTDSWLLKLQDSGSTPARVSSATPFRMQEFPALECGEFRKAVKNGADADSHLVDVSRPIATTLSTMGGWSEPTSYPDNNRIASFETTVWVVNATLAEYKRGGDQDYHLNLRDGSGNTMIAEIPCPCCVAASSAVGTLIAAARASFDARFTPTGTLQPANVAVRVAGVGMFDFPHGQIGAAPNYIELHPVVGISFDVDVNAPFIVSAVLNGKKLIVSGFNFDEATVVLVDGGKQKTRNDDDTPGNLLIAKKAGKFIFPGQTVTLQVRKSDGTLSEGFAFTRPMQ